MNKHCDGCCDIIKKTAVYLPCCDTVFCSNNCTQTSQQLFHTMLCCREGSHTQSLILNNPQLNVNDLSHFWLLLQLLASTVQHPYLDPLQILIMNQLTATYGGSYLTSFDFDKSIVIPTAILQDLSINVFIAGANGFYDTSVIQVILARIHNNDNGKGDENDLWHVIHPLFTFFNHLCAPNVE